MTPDRDGVVRRVMLRYKNHKVGSHFVEYSSPPDTVISRSVHRLALLVPVNE